MADLPSSFSKVNDVEVAQDAPVTEALFNKMGSNDNYLKDEVDTIKGAGPVQSLTTLKARVENAKNVTLIYSDVYVVNPVGGVAAIPQFQVTIDSGTYRLERIEGGPHPTFPYTRTTALNTAIAVSTSTRFWQLQVESTSANLFFTVRIYQIDSV